MELPVWLKVTFLVVILVAQAGWILNLLKRIAQAVGLYKSDEQLARIYLEKERLRSNGYNIFDEQAYKEQLRRQVEAEVRQAQADQLEKDRRLRAEQEAREEYARRQRDVTPEAKRLPSPIKLLGMKKVF